MLIMSTFRSVFLFVVVCIEKCDVLLPIVCNGCNCDIRHRACQAVCAAGGRAFIAEQQLRHV